jgi:hypothetical protein
MLAPGGVTLRVKTILPEFHIGLVVDPVKWTDGANFAPNYVSCNIDGIFL